LSDIDLILTFLAFLNFANSLGMVLFARRLKRLQIELTLIMLKLGRK
jgi:hypothetical protein